MTCNITLTTKLSVDEKLKLSLERSSTSLRSFTLMSERKRVLVLKLAPTIRLQESGLQAVFFGLIATIRLMMFMSQ